MMRGRSNCGKQSVDAEMGSAVDANKSRVISLVEFAENRRVVQGMMYLQTCARF